MHDFDETRRRRHEERIKELGDRSFTFGGKTMHFRANAPYAVTQSIAALTETTDGSAVFDTLEKAVVDLIDPDDRDLFWEACRDDNFPVTFDDLLELANWLIERQTSRPPTPAESSAPSSPATGTTLTETSFTEQAEA